jgi:hypothetical protein
MKINEIIKEDASGFTDPSARQRTQGIQSYQDVATAPAEPAQAPAATTPGAPSKLDKLKQLGGTVGNYASKAVDKAFSAYNTVAAPPAGLLSKIAGKGNAKGTADVFIDRWNQAVAQNPDLKTDTQALMNFMAKSTEKSGIEVPPPTGDISKSAVVAQYITDVISKSMAARAINAPAARPNTKGIEIVAGVDNPNDPPVVSFQGQNYYIDPNESKWVDSRGEPPIPPLQQKFFQAFAQAAPNNLAAKNALIRASQNPPVDQSAPQTQNQTQTPPIKLKRVNVQGAEYAEKHPDGNWYDGQGDQIVRPNEIAELERRASQPPASAGAYVR